MRALPNRVIAAFILLCLPYLALGIWLERTKGLQSEAAFVASVVLLMCATALAARTWRRFFLLQFPLLLLGAAFAAYTLSFDARPGKSIALVLATSSWAEFQGFFGIWQGKRMLLAALSLALLYLLLAVRSPSRPMFSGGNKYLYWGLVSAVILPSAYAAQNAVAFVEGVAANPVIGTAMFVAGPLRDANASVDGRAIRKLPYGASRVDQDEEVHILVIGESARRDSWSVYGYQRETTPKLEKLRGETIFFQHAVADANLTIYAVPILLTGIAPSRFDMKAITGSLVDLAEEAGYSTTWLMNQDPHISLLTGIHADRMAFPPISTVVEANLPLDETLLPGLQHEIERRGKSRFIGLHMFGSHWEYALRYPAAFKHFGSGTELSHLSFLSGQPDPRVLDAYDNSVTYTDWFLGQVIDQARTLSVPATVTYISDHGEDLLMLDGRAGHGTHAYSKHQFDIPAFVWVNAAYRQVHPAKVQAMTQNAAKEVRSHNVFYSLADLMGIQWPGASPAQSFASTSFIPDLSPQVIAGGALISRVE